MGRAAVNEFSHPRKDLNSGSDVGIRELMAARLRVRKPSGPICAALGMRGDPHSPGCCADCAEV